MIYCVYLIDTIYIIIFLVYNIITMSNLIAIRIHLAALGSCSVQEFHERLLKVVGQDAGYVIVKEDDAERPHYQGWIRPRDGDDATKMRMRFRTRFPECAGNRSYSLKPVRDEEKYKDYCMKGRKNSKPDIVLKHSMELDDMEMMDRHDRYWNSHSSSSKLCLVDRLVEWCKSFDERPPVREIVKECMEYIAEMKKPMMQHYIIGVVKTVVFKLDGSEKNVMIDYITSCICPYGN